MMRGNMRLAFWLLWSLLAGILALGHLLFAFENFRFGGLALLEGVFAALAGLALLASIIIFRHSPMKAATAVVAGSLSLTAYFALASLLVEPASQFVLLSLVVPATAAIVIVLTWFFGER
jgi:hypothetical protein